MGYINNRRNSFKKMSETRPEPYREPFLCAEEIEGKKYERAEFASLIPVDFSNPTEEIQTERDFRMLQSMYPNAAKELLPFIEEACDRMEYEGSAMFDEYPDFTTVYTMQKKIAAAAAKDRMTAGEKDRAVDQHLDSGEGVNVNTKGNTDGAGAAEDVCVPLEEMIRVMVLQEMHRRRERHRFCRNQCGSCL